MRVDGNGLRREVVGDFGLGDDDVLRLLTGLDARADQLDRQRRSGWAILPAGRTELRHIRRLRDEIGDGFTDVVLLASPEIALGTRALATALGVQDPVGPPAGPRLHVLDGPDPDRFTALVQTLDWARTLFVVASVGDADLPTTSHFLVVRDRLLRELGAVAYQRHIVVVTSPGDTVLGQIVHDEGFRSLRLADGIDHGPAVLGPAGLLSLACAGVDVGDLVTGGAAMLERRATAEGMRPAHLLALAVQVASPGGIRVAPPAVQSLRDLACWMERRLAIATTTETDVPSHRRVTLLLGEAPRADAPAIPKAYQDVESIGCVGGRDLGALAAHERDAEEMARWADGELTVTVLLPDGSAHALGQVVALAEAAACLAGPADEATSMRDRATRLAFGLVGRPGYEPERATAERLAALREERWVA